MIYNNYCHISEQKKSNVLMIAIVTAFIIDNIVIVIIMIIINYHHSYHHQTTLRLLIIILGASGNVPINLFQSHSPVWCNFMWRSLVYKWNQSLTCIADDSLFSSFLLVCSVIGEKNNSYPQVIIISSFTLLQMLIIPAGMKNNIQSHLPKPVS